jgi:hypothetical protein
MNDAAVATRPACCRAQDRPASTRGPHPDLDPPSPSHVAGELLAYLNAWNASLEGPRDDYGDGTREGAGA